MKSLAEKMENLLEIGGLKKDITLLVIGAVSLVMSLAKINILPFDIAWIAIIVCGTPILMDTFIGLATEFDIKADLLVSMALIASVYLGEFFAAGEVAFIMQLGALLEDITSERAKASIEKLVNMTPQTARVLRNGVETVIPAQEVAVGDILRVLPGETIAVDGRIIRGKTSVNQAVMTGEPIPVDKAEGDEVSSGTLNQFGSFEMVATKVGEDSSIQRMIRLVQSADAGKAKIVGLADRWATWIVVISFLTAVATWIFTGQLIRAATVLIVFCPCAFVLATPTAIIAAIGNATGHGFLVREGDALERLSKVDKIAFDKTGTLTYGKPVVIKVKAADGTDEETLFNMAASAEAMSEHPLAKAVVTSYKEKYTQPLRSADDFVMLLGRGISARIDDKKVIIGNLTLLVENGITVDNAVLEETDEYLNNGSTIVYIAVDDEYAGYIVLSDTVRDESPALIRKISDTGMTTVLLTGDNHNSAAYIAQQTGIQEYKAGCLPEDKMTYIKEMLDNGQSVCMIGDGINDAPSLKLASVGIAMGSVGSDIAVDAADIVVVDDEIRELPHLLKLSKRMMTTIKMNLIFSMGLNLLAVVLSISGVLNPVLGALVHNAGSVAVITNSAFLMKWK
ncbi:MAG: cation-translocating P-type ATPase [Oscillospiraceae bacterium]|nr:cation-translocating P-type ATPase [Oscillospiraceae bacterium]